MKLSQLGMVVVALSLSASPLLAAGKNSAKAAKVEHESCLGADGQKIADIKTKDKCVAPNKWGKVEKTAKTAVPPTTEKK